MTVVALDRSGVVAANPGGQELFASDWSHRYIALEGGWGSGKTWVGARKLVTLHLHNAFGWDDQPSYVWSAAIAPTYRNALDYDIPALDETFEEANVKAKFRASLMAYELPDLGTRERPSLVLVRTAETPERIAGWEAGAIWGDEASRWSEDPHDPRRDPITQTYGRSRHKRARLVRLFYTYTPEGDHTRIHRQFHSGYEDHAHYTSSSIDNVRNTGDFVEAQTRHLSRELYDQYILGKAISLRGGCVYTTFTREGHVIRGDVDADPNLPLHLSLDFNIAPGMHAEIGQYFKDLDKFIVLDELFAPRLDVRGLVEAFARWVQKRGGWKWPELQVFGDATGRSQWAGTGESCYGVLGMGLKHIANRWKRPMEWRFRVSDANPPIVDRVNAMNVAMCDFNGVVHWQCSERCDKLIEDLEGMRRDRNGNLDDRENTMGHASAAEGYRVSYVRPARVSIDRSPGQWSVDPQTPLPTMGFPVITDV